MNAENDDPSTVPVLRTTRLMLRPPEERDIPAWYARATDREAAFMAGDPIPESIALGETWLVRTRERAAFGERLLWSIDIVDGARSIGTVGLTLTEPGISFVIGRAFWGRGYATESAREVLNYGITVLGFTKVGSEIVVSNIGSRRVLEKLGFRYVENFVDDSDGAECERYILDASTRE